MSTTSAGIRTGMTADESTGRPLSPARPATARSPDVPPPLPPREVETDRGACLRFLHEGEEWIARTAGKGAGGTGAYGLGMMEALHFCRASDPTRPLFEVLIAAGAFNGLFEEELSQLLRRARRIVTLEERRSEGEHRGGRTFEG